MMMLNSVMDVVLILIIIPQKVSKKNQKKEIKTIQSKNDKKELVTKLPLILAIIGIIVSIAEGLGTPMLMGMDNILTAIELA